MMFVFVCTSIASKGGSLSSDGGCVSTSAPSRERDGRESKTFNRCRFTTIAGFFRPWPCSHWVSTRQLVLHASHRAENPIFWTTQIRWQENNFPHSTSHGQINFTIARQGKWEAKVKSFWSDESRIEMHFGRSELISLDWIRSAIRPKHKLGIWVALISRERRSRSSLHKLNKNTSQSPRKEPSQPVQFICSGLQLKIAVMLETRYLMSSSKIHWKLLHSISRSLASDCSVTDRFEARFWPISRIFRLSSFDSDRVHDCRDDWCRLHHTVSEFAPNWRNPRCDGLN